MESLRYSIILTFGVSLAKLPRVWGTTDAEIKNLVMGWIPGLYNIKGALFPKPGVGLDIALHAAPADRTSTALLSAFPIHSTSFLLPKFSDPQQWDAS